MRELLYVPPDRTTERKAIGLLVPELTNPVFPALAQAMEARATAAGLVSILGSTRAAAFREVDYVHMLLDHRVDGMIFISCEMTHLAGDHAHYARLLEEGARIVFVNGALDTLDVPSVGVDERHAGQLATQHLIELGHERIGFVAGPDYYLPTMEKAAGREDALRLAGLAPDGLIAHGEFTADGGRRALRELLAREPPEALALALALGAPAEPIARYADVLRFVRLSIDGDDLLSAGVQPSPALGRALAETLRRKLDGQVADRDEELRVALALARGEEDGR